MRIGDSVWHAKRKCIPNAEIAEFEKPTEIRTRCNFLTVMPLTSRGYAEVMKYGEDIDNTWTVIANDRAFHDKIHNGDLFWVDGHKPINRIESKYGFGSSANAVVKDVSYINHTMSIVITKNKNQVEEECTTNYEVYFDKLGAMTYDIQSCNYECIQSNKGGSTVVIGD